MNKKYRLILLCLLAALIGLAALGIFLFRDKQALNDSYISVMEDQHTLPAFSALHEGETEGPDSITILSPDGTESEKLSLSGTVPSGEAVSEEADSEKPAFGESSAEEAIPEEADSEREASTEKVTENESSKEKNTEKDQQTLDALAAALAAANAALPEHQIIFVGDSRTVGMGEAEAKLGDGCLYVGKSGEGYEWFKEEGLEEMDKVIKENPDLPVVLNLGVNDPDNLTNYLNLYRSFDELYPDTDFYYMSVNPITEDVTFPTSEQIGDFNAALKEVFPDQYLDCYTQMMIWDFETVDGLHYTREFYCKIHDFVVKKLFK